MKRCWLGVALLSGSWMLGSGYFQPAAYGSWLMAVVVGAVLLESAGRSLPGRQPMIVAFVLLLPCAWIMPFPYKAVPVLMAIGLASQVLPFPRRWPPFLGRGALVAAVVLLGQAVVLWAYAAQTARSHELPWPLTTLLGTILRLTGLDVAVDGSHIVIRALGEVHRLGATWELLFDPASACFLAGGLVMLARVTRDGLPPGQRWPAWLKAARTLALLVAAWLPVRAALLVAIYLTRALRANAVSEPNVAAVLANGWTHAALLIGPALLAIRFLGRTPCPRTGGTGTPSQAVAEPRRTFVAPALVGLAVAVLTTALLWDPVGQPKEGRVMVVERHSTWEPTTEPYGTKVYGEAGSYNYAAAYDYCSQFYRMSRLLESQPIDDATLRNCDVLIIKTPTARYEAEEVAAVVRFVERGGGLLLVGDHTNVFNMNTYLNDISRYFGFTFCNDLLFRTGSPYYQPYRPPVAAHPVVQNIPPMKFAVSCSIDPGSSLGRMVIRNTGLWNLPPAYHEMNYHPQAEYRADLRCGAFCQLWSTCHGRGRVLAFADSTLFSNFCTFQEGKLELLLGMTEWLNHRSPLDQRPLWLLLVVPTVLAGLALLVTGLWLARTRDDGWILMTTAGLLGWTISATAVSVAHHRAMPPPRVERPRPHVVIDRTVSEAPLFTGAFAKDAEGLGYGMLEQWIPRLGFWATRRAGADAFSGDALVIICPTRSVTRRYREQLVDYVNAGGRLLVFDSPDTTGSTANSLLWPFGLASNHNTSVASPTKLRLAKGTTDAELQASCEITGGQPIAWLTTIPVAARIEHGQGSVTAVGFGSLFNDANMGFHWLPEPTEHLLGRYTLLYDLIRAATKEPAATRK